MKAVARNARRIGSPVSVRSPSPSSTSSRRRATRAGGAGSGARTRAIPSAEATNEAPSMASAPATPSVCTSTPASPGPATSVAALLVARAPFAAISERDGTSEGK